MKRMKKLLTGLLTLGMTLSMMTMTAFAAGPTTGTTEKMPTIDFDVNKTGSITIHKYEFNGADNEKKTATGESNDDVPNGANPLKDATFTAYQVWDKDALSEYYNGSSDKKLPSVDSLIKMESGNYVVESETKTPKVAEGTTDVNGIATLKKDIQDENSTDLPLGLYLVVETQSPASVTTRCTPFLVSVPMTRIGTTKPGEEWLYDVHVYPKNKTDYGEITLIKKGQVGNGEASETLSGVTFKLYKFVGTKTGGKISPFTTTNHTDDLNDTTMMWKQIKKSSTASGDNTGTEIGPEGLLTTSNVGEITVSGLSAGYYCFVEQGVGNNKAFITDQTPHYFEVKGETSQEITVANDGTVTEKADSTAAANLKLTVTDPRPDVEKKVKDRAPAENGDDYVKASDYSVGDEIPYKITVKVPQALLNAKVESDANFVFEVKDTPENLEDKNVKAISSTGEVVTEGVAITPDSKPNDKGGIGFTASFTQAALKALVGEEGDTFTITYTATLLKGADMTVNGNKNTINLKYSNKIDADGKINPDTSEIEDGAVVYTFSIHVDKRGEKKDGDALPGVKFNVYKEVAKGTPDAVKGSTIGITGEDKDNWFVKVVIDDKKNDDTKYDLVTGPDGKAQVDGLANGTYYLVETATVNGYNLLSGPVKVTIQVSYSESWTAKDDYVGDKLVHHEETLHKEYFGGKEGAPGNGYILTTIINRKGFNLPTTGGFGTLLFSGIGVLLVVAGVGVLLSLKKKNRA